MIFSTRSPEFSWKSTAGVVRTKELLVRVSLGQFDLRAPGQLPGLLATMAGNKPALRTH
jgi:hypothetical protein